MKNWKQKVIQIQNEQKKPQFGAELTAIFWNLFLSLDPENKKRILEVFEAGYTPTSMNLLDDEKLVQLAPHLPSIERIQAYPYDTMILEACKAVAFEPGLNKLSRDERIIILQSAIWYVIGHSK